MVGRLQKRKIAEDDEFDLELDESATENISGNMVYMTGAISTNTVSPVIAFIASSNIANEHNSLVIFINSGGGHLTEGFALANAIAASRIPIVTVAIGECASAALIIAMSGDYRLIGPDTSLMSHQYSAGIGLSKHTDLKARVKDLETTASRVIKHYSKYTGLDEKSVKKQLVNATDVFLTPEEAISLNLFDDLFVDFGQFIDFGDDVEEVDTVDLTEPAEVLLEENV